MKNIPIVLFFFFLTILCSCNFKQQYKVTGRLSGSQYNDEYIYLVPFKGATQENVDSALIENGMFVFKGTVEKPGIYILRMRPVLRLRLQELLIVKEPGSIEVQIDSVSSAKGTPENDLLQTWKDQMSVLKNDERLEYNKLFIKKYQGTLVGDFVAEMTK